MSPLPKQPFEAGPARAAVGSFPFPHKTVAEVDTAEEVVRGHFGLVGRASRKER